MEACEVVSEVDGLPFGVNGREACELVWSMTLVL